MASITTAAAQARVKLLLLQAHLQANLQAQLKLFPLHASLAAIATPCKLRGSIKGVGECE